MSSPSDPTFWPDPSPNPDRDPDPDPDPNPNPNPDPSPNSDPHPIGFIHIFTGYSVSTVAMRFLSCCSSPHDGYISRGK